VFRRIIQLVTGQSQWNITREGNKETEDDRKEKYKQETKEGE
jgi:hypothetical protein